MKPLIILLTVLQFSVLVNAQKIAAIELNDCNQSDFHHSKPETTLREIFIKEDSAWKAIVDTNYYQKKKNKEQRPA